MNEIFKKIEQLINHRKWNDLQHVLNIQSFDIFFTQIFNKKICAVVAKDIKNIDIVFNIIDEKLENFNSLKQQNYKNINQELIKNHKDIILNKSLNIKLHILNLFLKNLKEQSNKIKTIEDIDFVFDFVKKEFSDYKNTSFKNNIKNKISASNIEDLKILNGNILNFIYVYFAEDKDKDFEKFLNTKFQILQGFNNIINSMSHNTNYKGSILNKDYFIFKVFTFIQNNEYETDFFNKYSKSILSGAIQFKEFYVGEHILQNHLTFNIKSKNFFSISQSIEKYKSLEEKNVGFSFSGIGHLNSFLQEVFYHDLNLIDTFDYFFSDEKLVKQTNLSLNYNEDTVNIKDYHKKILIDYLCNNNNKENNKFSNVFQKRQLSQPSNFYQKNFSDFLNFKKTQVKNEELENKCYLKNNSNEIKRVKNKI